MAIEWESKSREELLPGELFISNHKIVGFGVANEDNEVMPLLLGEYGSRETNLRVVAAKDISKTIRVVAKGNWEIKELEESGVRNSDRFTQGLPGNIYVEPSGDRFLILAGGEQGAYDFANLDDGTFSGPGGGSVLFRKWELLVRNLERAERVISQL